MSDKLTPLFEVEDTVNLEGLGYGKGSHAAIVVNPTKAFRREWNALFEAQEGESEDDAEARQFARQYELAPNVIKSVTVCNKAGELVWEAKPLTADSARVLDEDVDSRILNVAMTELFERSAAEVVNVKVGFRGERTRRITGRQEDKVEPAPAGDKPTNSDVPTQ